MYTSITNERFLGTKGNHEVALKKCLLTAVLFCLICSVHGQKVQWLSFEGLADSLRMERKPILIFIHTDWCKFCKAQEKTTFANPSLTARLATDYYAVRFNAEEATGLKFLGRMYRKPADDYHELAQFLGKEKGRLEFPTTVLLSADFQLKERIVGYASAVWLSESLD